MDTYEKKYNEALNWMRELYPGLHGATKEDAEHYFPELRESEDERIRKTLLEHFNERNSYRDEDETFNSVPFSSIITYLEKQKDASKAIEAVDRIDKYIDEHLANAHDMKDSNPDKKYYRGWDDALGKMAGILQDVYSEKKQKEQKPELVQQTPITYTYNSNASRDERLKAALLALLNSDLLKVKEGGYFTKQDLIEWVEKQKPVEWSEEDDWKREELIQYLEEKGDYRTVWMSWLKSLRPQPKDKIYEEKDEAFKPGKLQLALSFMNYLEENRPEGKMSLSNGECEDINKAFKENDWAKIIRYIEKYQPHWKPSDEQMRALADTLEDMPEHYKPKCTLETLERDLKKLM